MFKRHFNPSLADSYRQDNFIRFNLFFSIIANILIWLFIFSQVKNFSEMIPLHYNIYFGINLLGYWHKIFYLPGLGLGFLILNFSLGSLAYQQEKILSYFLAGFSTFFQFILILSTILIIWINL